MYIEYVDRPVRNYCFGDIGLSEIFMDKDGTLYLRCDTIADILHKQYNAVSVETGYHKFFFPDSPVQAIKSKLVVEI